MLEDEVLRRAIAWFSEREWELIYHTRAVADGAIGGVDAILVKKLDPWKFIFIDAKGSAETKEKRSRDFTSCLGALIKRIRFRQGYLSNEKKDCFTGKNCRKQLCEFAVHKNSEYVLALTTEMRETVRKSLDPTLAALLKIRVLLVSEPNVEEMKW